MNNVIALLLMATGFGSQAYVPVQGWSPSNPDALQGSQTELSIRFQPLFNGEKVLLETPMKGPTPDSLVLHTLRLYLSNFVFLKNEAVVYEEKNSRRLLDLEDTNSLNMKFQLPEKLDFDALAFDLGIDSLTNVSGAMGGDLDPTKGMFWTWQSGYVNVKLEGFFEKCATRNHEFQFHLGGYLAPFQSVQPVQLSVSKKENLRLQLDLAPLFEKVDWTKHCNIMSPSKEAVTFSDILANSFSIHGE